MSEAIQLTPRDYIAFMVQAMKAGIPVFVVGQPGIGKSACNAEAARIAGFHHVLSHPAIEDPTDIKGIPFPDPDGKGAHFLAIGQLHKITHATEPTLWDIDDFGQSVGATQAGYMQAIHAREINGIRIPDCVSIVAASNRRTDRAGVQGILEPVKSRFATIVELVPDLDDYNAWQIREGFDPIWIAWSRFAPDLLCDFQPTADMENSPLPRTWANAARLHALNLPAHVWAKVLCGAVGESAGTKFLAFERMYKEIPSVDGILIDPDAAPIPERSGVLCAVVTALATRVTVANFPRIARYAERLHENSDGEFSALLLRDCVRRDSAVTQTPAFVKLATGELGKLISGGI